MLELDDIQHILLTRTPALTGEYVFLSFRNPASGRAWLNGLVDKVRSAAVCSHRSLPAAMGDPGLHLEWVARTRTRRGIAGQLS